MSKHLQIKEQALSSASQLTKSFDHQTMMCIKKRLSFSQQKKVANSLMKCHEQKLESFCRKIERKVLLQMSLQDESI